MSETAMCTAVERLAQIRDGLVEMLRQKSALHATDEEKEEIGDIQDVMIQVMRLATDLEENDLRNRRFAEIWQELSTIAYETPVYVWDHETEFERLKQVREKELVDELRGMLSGSKAPSCDHDTNEAEDARKENDHEPGK